MCHKRKNVTCCIISPMYRESRSTPTADKDRNFGPTSALACLHTPLPPKSRRASPALGSSIRGCFGLRNRASAKISTSAHPCSCGAIRGRLLQIPEPPPLSFPGFCKKHPLGLSPLLPAWLECDWSGSARNWKTSIAVGDFPSLHLTYSLISTK